MCIGGSGLCMEGEQRKNQSPARRAGSRVWVRDSDPDWSQRRDQGAGGVTDTQWSQSIMWLREPIMWPETETSTPGVQWWSEPVTSCLCYFKMGKTVSCCKLSTRGFVSTLLQWKFLKSFIKSTYYNNNIKRGYKWLWLSTRSYWSVWSSLKADWQVTSWGPTSPSTVVTTRG